MPRKRLQLAMVPAFPPPTLELLLEAEDRMLAPLRAPPLLQRSAAIATLMEELEHQRQEAEGPQRRRGRRRKPFLADDERFALAEIVARSEFWGMRRHRAALIVAGNCSPGRAARADGPMSIINNDVMEIHRLLMVGSDPDARAHHDRARTLEDKLRRLNPAEWEWCRMSARNLAFFGLGFSTKRTHSLVAACRLAQLGWAGELPEGFRIGQAFLRYVVARHPRREL